MHKNDFFPFIFFSYHSFSLSYLEPQIIFPCRDIETRDRDIGPATATVDPRPATRDPRPATRDPRLLVKLILQHYRVFRSDFRGQPSTVNSRVLHGSLILCKTRDNRKSQREKISQIYGVASILN